MSSDPTAVFRYFPQLTDTQRKQFSELFPLYSEWNEKINVISRKDIGNLYTHHVLHSLGIAKVVTFSPGEAVIDIGTGGGFPGIPLAILFPDTTFHLVDSIGKKIRVVEAVAQALGLKNVSAEQARSEQLKSKFDFVVSRAVTTFPEFYSITRHLVRTGGKTEKRNGILYLKGGDLTAELAPFKSKVLVYELNKWFDDPFFETKRVVYLPF